MLLNIIKRCASSTSSSYSDFIICGGGLVGMTIGCALGKHPSLKDKSITLIEAAQSKTYVKGQQHSNRVSAISPFSKSLLDRLGIWKHIHRYRQVNNMKVWGIHSDSFLEIGDEEGIVAYIVENDDIIQAISQEVSSLPVKFLNKKINEVKIDTNKPMEATSKPKLVLEDRSEYTCQLLIGADGVNSLIRKSMNVDYLTWSYQQMAVVATLNVSACDTNTTAWQRFLPKGPVALLPLTNELSSLVWSTTKEEALTLLKLPNENFVDALNSALRKQYDSNNLVKAVNNSLHQVLNMVGMRRIKNLGDPPCIQGVVDGSRAVFPLGFGHSVNYVCPHVALIGDAAHRVHPLAGQGVNIGFGDIACLEKVLSDGIRNGRELSDIEDLSKYETLSQRNNVPVMMLIELIHRLYTSNLAPIQALGDIGIEVLNAYPLKEILNRVLLFSRNPF